jgi:flavin reductase (DIM6/NTAB) family NADH-FMN oxidoreductase RutF
MALTEPVPRPIEPAAPADEGAVDADLFRHAFRRHAASVVVVTYIDSSGSPRGMTATAVCALSVDPPSLIVCIDRSTLTHEEVMHRRTFAIDMLSTSQRRISAHCSRRGLDKRLHDGWLVPATGPDEPPHLAGSVAHLVCTIESALDAFTHTIVVGRVRSIWLNPLDPEPLLYHDGAYTRLLSTAGGEGGDILGIAPLALPDPLDEED